MDKNMPRQPASHYRQVQQMPPPGTVQHPRNQTQQSYQHYSQQGAYEHVRRNIYNHAQHGGLHQGAHHHEPQIYGPQVQRTSQCDPSKDHGLSYTGIQHQMNSYSGYPPTMQTPPTSSVAPQMLPYPLVPNATYATNVPTPIQPSPETQHRVPLSELHTLNQQQYHGTGRRVLQPSGPSRDGRFASGLPMTQSTTDVPAPDFFYNNENVLHAGENANKRLKTSKTGFFHIAGQIDAQPLKAPKLPYSHAVTALAVTTGGVGKRKVDGRQVTAVGASNSTSNVPAIAIPASSAPSATPATAQTKQPAPIRPLSSALRGLGYSKTASSYLTMSAALAKLNEPQWYAPKLPLEVELRDSNVNQYERLIYNAMIDFRGFYDLVEQPTGEIPRDGPPHIYDHRLIDRGSLNEDDLHLAAYNITDKLIKVHTVGTSCRGPADPTNLKGIESEREWPFHERLALICDALTKFKSLVLQCVDEPGNVEHLVVLAPKYALDSRIASMKNNDIKAAKTRANAEKKVLSEKQIAQALKRKEKAKKEKLTKATKPAAGPDAYMLQSQDPQQQGMLKAASHGLRLKKIAHQRFFDYVSPNGHNVTAAIMRPAESSDIGKGEGNVEADGDGEAGSDLDNHGWDLGTDNPASGPSVPPSVFSAGITSDHSLRADTPFDTGMPPWMDPEFDPSVDFGDFSFDPANSNFDSEDFDFDSIFDNSYTSKALDQVQGEESAGSTLKESAAQTSNGSLWAETFND